MSRLSHAQKEQILEALRRDGTLKAGAVAAGVEVKAIMAEMKTSLIFQRRIAEARDEGRQSISDTAIQLMRDYLDGKYEKTDRNRLTAAIALANAFLPGFRGSTRVEGKIEHNVRVLTAVPRPKYDELPAPAPLPIESKSHKIKTLPTDPEALKDLEETNQAALETLDMLNYSKPVTTIERFNQPKPHTVEEIIEGEVVEDNSDKEGVRG